MMETSEIKERLAELHDEPQELGNFVREVIREAVKADTLQQDAILDALCTAPQYANRKTTLKKFLSELKNEERAKNNAPVAPRISISEHEPHEFHPAQDFIGDLGIFTIRIPLKGGGYLRHFITSDRRVIPAYVETAEELGLSVNVKHRDKFGSVIVPLNSRWSVSSKIPFNVHQFISGSVNINPAELYQEVTEFISRYVLLKEGMSYDYLALFIIQSYLYRLFDSVGYITLEGPKRSGKTRTLEVLEALCFNSRMAGSASEATIFRMVESDCCTLLIDEASRLSSTDNNETSTMLDIVRTGYKRSGVVFRCDGETHVPQAFSSFSPKVFATTLDFENALNDRAVNLGSYRKRADENVGRFLTNDVEPTAMVLRNKLYCFALAYFREIRDIYINIPPFDGIEDREEEIWRGIFSIAEFMKSHGAVPFCKSAVAVPLDSLMFMMAKRNKNKKSEREIEENNLDAVFIQTIWDMIHNDDPEMDSDIFTGEQIRLYYCERNKEKNFGKNKIGMMLVRLGICLEDDKSQHAVREKIGEGGFIKKYITRTCYRITKERVLEAARNFSVPLVSYDFLR